MRPAFDALFAIDDAMAHVVASASQPALAAIKLAWWREALEKLDSAPAPAEPRLIAAAEELLPRGVSGRELAELEAGWAALIEEKPEPEPVLERGARLFGVAARLLGSRTNAGLELAGRLYAAGDLKRRGIGSVDTSVATDLPRFPRQLRPLTAMAALARRDVLQGSEPEATPGRAWTLLRHRITGR